MSDCGGDVERVFSFDLSLVIRLVPEIRFLIASSRACCSSGTAGTRVCSVPLLAMVAERIGRSCRTRLRIASPVATLEVAGHGECGEHDS